MNDKIICEKCGAEMVDRSNGNSIEVECPKCGWGWATITYDSTDDDNTPYEVWLLPGNSQNIEVLRLVSSIANVNYVQAKKMLDSNEPTILFKATKEPISTQNNVHKIQSIANMLTGAEIAFSILPNFPYDVCKNDIKPHNKQK